MRESMGGYPSPASDGAALHLRRSPVSTPPLASDRDAAPSAGFRWGFVSLDCGGKENYTDELGLNWTPDDYLIYGEAKDISTEYETGKQYTSMRLFPADSRKYCYKLNVLTKIRYLIRATFFYGDFDSNNVYPKFDISFGATHWSTIEILDTTVVVRELIFLASSPTIDVCLSNAATGQPFISTLELRQFNGSIYGTLYEDRFYLKVSRRINFGADSEAPVRYPDDPFDRIWKSDNLNKSDYLADKAVGTVKVSTKLPIVMNDREEMPPEKVMQTAVVGTNGSLTYRLSLDSFPGFGWANMYLAEIEDLELNESRKFRVVHTDHPELSNDIINIQENAHGKDRAFEAGFRNMSLPFILSFKLEKTADSSRGPLLNAMEINSYLKRNDGSLDGGAIENVIALDSSADWAQEGGDPCLPVPWSWLQCNSDPRPSITVIHLSSKNLKGDIPLDLTKLSKLVELWLDGNSLTGSIPDFSICPDLKIIHLENNRLTGELPSSLSNLPNLRELHVQNNRLSGTVPSGLLNKNLDLNYSGNIDLHGKRVKHNIIIGSTVGAVGAAVLLIATIVSCLFFRKGKKSHYDQDHVRNSLPVRRPVSSRSDAPSEAAHCFTLSDIEEATNSFEKKIGSGGFGVVYYGKLKDGKEIAVKVLTSNSYQGKREFSNEVILLSRIHHRNLIQFLGYCQEKGRSMLVYEFMQNGTLKEHLYGVLTSGQSINWIKRLEIAEDAAKVDGAFHVSSVVRGTMGYLDPEYYIAQQLTDKSDVYSFGVILLELISGQEPISKESFGVNCYNIIEWAKMHIESGDIQGIIDRMIRDEYDIQSMWKIAKKALMCVEPHGNMRPSISEVLKDIQDAILIEREAATTREGNSDEMSRNYVHS
ncbi:hypothetical protein QYF36_022777 [Acer negundo]|nr:hypothetical protein QYF36_022777 [Acer negundo]